MIAQLILCMVLIGARQYGEGGRWLFILQALESIVP